MAGLYSHTARADGLTLTASIYNTDHQNHIDNMIPTKMDDYSTTVSEMRTATDPGEDGSESLASDLSGEIARLRFAIKEIKGTTYWYETPSTDLSSSLDSENVNNILAVQVFS